VLTAIVVLVVVATRIGILGVASDREYDEGVYLLSARALLAGHRLFADIFSSQPPGFLETLGVAMRIAGDRLETARAVMLGFAVLAMLAIASIARRTSGSWAAPVAVASLATGATFLDLAHIVQAEMPAMAVALAAMAACLRARALSWHRGWLASAGALFAVALLMKLLVAPLAIPLAFLLLLTSSDSGEPRWQLDGAGVLLVRRTLSRATPVAAAAIVVLALPLLFYDAHAMHEQVIRFQLQKNAVYRHEPLLNMLRASRQLTANVGLAAMAAFGLAVLLRRNVLAGTWLILWFATSLAVLALQSPLFWRHFSLLTPIVALAAASVAAASSWRSAFGRASWSIMIVLFVWSTFFTGRTRTRDNTIPEEPERGVARLLATAEWIRTQTDDDDIVAGDDPMAVYLAGRQAPPGICDTSRARIAAGSLTLQKAVRDSRLAHMVVLRANGRLSTLRGYTEWLAREATAQPAATPIATYRTFWIRNP
jgi:hypothetical protein